MPYPVFPMHYPSGITSPLNGRLPSAMLVNVSSWRASGQMHPFLWDAFKRIRVDAQRHGFNLTWTANPYRSYAEQVALFKRRYEVGWIAGRRHEFFEGKWWSLKAGAAGAANPGTSNHGYGLAVDLALYLADRDTIISIGPAMPYLLDGVVELCGCSWESQSEPWHIRYVRGVALPTGTDPPVRPGSTTWTPEFVLLHAFTSKPTIRAFDGSDETTFHLQGAVRYLQFMLKTYANQVQIVFPYSGVFDGATDAGVRRLQAFTGATVDGVVGPQTWGKIDALGHP